MSFLLRLIRAAECSSRTTRQSNQIHLPKVRTEIAKRSFCNGSVIYNKLKFCKQLNSYIV